VLLIKSPNNADGQKGCGRRSKDFRIGRIRQLRLEGNSQKSHPEIP
jgi:hypothetical protein